MAVKHDINNFIIDRFLRGVMTSKTDGSFMWSVSQMTNPQLTMSTEEQNAVDATGATIMSFERAKNAEFSAENSVFDLGLYAAQAGTEKKYGSDESKITAFEFEEIEVTGATINLKRQPIGQIMSISEINSDGSITAHYKNGTEANETDFVHADGAQEITLPTSVKPGAVIFVQYDYEAASGVMVENKATEFPRAGVFRAEVLGVDICDTSKLIHAYIEFMNAKLDSNVDITFTTEGTHPFTIKAMQDYCDREKRLFRIIIPDEE